jgi:hypothetical protein
MRTTRRDFIKSFGISLATIIITRCVPFQSESDTHEVNPVPSNTPKAASISPEERIRECWLNLEVLAKKAREDGEHAGEVRGELVNEHQAALLIMINSGDLDPNIAQEMQTAFEQASSHVEGINSNFVMCYESIETTSFFARDDLIQQADVLQELSADIDPSVLEEIQTTIAYDITYFDLVASSMAGRELNEQFEAGEMDILPEALEAAQLLVNIIQGD